MIMTGNRKRFALITVYVIVDAAARGVNLSKAQCGREIGRATNARKNRNKRLKDLVDHIKRCAVTDVIVA